ncbi:MAG: hypothetical protein C5B44_05725 [Acidobacteria bacterium]|nr:MAG: hypothetical protein C5B44_05725 [Acidobacteriota bacterium]
MAEGVARKKGRGRPVINRKSLTIGYGEKSIIPTADLPSSPLPNGLKSLTLDHYDFVAHLAAFDRPRKAAAYAGFAVGYAYMLAADPLIKQLVEEYRERLKARSDAGIDKAKEIVARENELIIDTADERIIQLLRRGQTHEYRGDADIVKAAEVAYKRAGKIDSAKVNVTAKAGAQAQGGQGGQGGNTVFEVYKANWLLQKEQAMAKQLEAGDAAQ